MSPAPPEKTKGKLPKRVLAMRGRARFTDTTGVRSWKVMALAKVRKVADTP